MVVALMARSQYKINYGQHHNKTANHELPSGLAVSLLKRYSEQADEDLVPVSLKLVSEQILSFAYVWCFWLVTWCFRIFLFSVANVNFQGLSPTERLSILVTLFIFTSPGSPSYYFKLLQVWILTPLIGRKYSKRKFFHNPFFFQNIHILLPWTRHSITTNELNSRHIKKMPSRCLIHY